MSRPTRTRVIIEQATTAGKLQEQVNFALGEYEKDYKLEVLDATIDSIDTMMGPALLMSLTINITPNG